jgi:hypothetical protein
VSEPLAGVDGSVAAASTLLALRRALPVVLFALLPAAVVIGMFTVAIDTGPLAWDFRNELYPQARDLVHGRNPYPEAIWPPIAAALAIPFTVLPSETAGLVFAIVGVACMGLALWLVDVRDWRVFGVVALWPQVIAEIRLAHLTPLLCLLVALVWRYRDVPLRSGVALGLAGAFKLFLWPLGVWLLATRRTGAALVAAGIAIASILLVLPFAPLDDYGRTLLDVSRAFDQDSYSLFGFLTQLDVSDASARAATFAVGGVLLTMTWIRRSLTLAIAAALVLSPIVWLDFYALAAIPLAIARPTLSPVWLLPLATWGLPSSGIATDPVWGVGRVILVFALVMTAAERAEHSGRAFK